MLLETHQPHVKDRRTGDAEAVPAPAGAVLFIFVNGRTPRGNAHCAVCCQQIDDRYVREVPTGLIYCNRHYDAGNSRISDVAPRSRARGVS